MPDQLQLRGGTTTEHNSFTGALREVTVDTTKKTLVVHDGSQAGGTPLMRENGGNAASSVQIGSGGVNALTIDGNQDIILTGASANVNWDKSANAFQFADNAKAQFGASNDLQIYHDGSNSYVSENGTGDLILTGGVIRPRTDQFTLNNAANTENMISAVADGAVKLFFNGSTKLQTDANGITVTGRVLATGISNIGFAGADNVKLSLGTSDDLQIYHDGTGSIIGNSTGTFDFLSPNEIRYRATTHHFKSYGNDETMAKFIDDGAVELYHNNTKMFETTSDGATLQRGLTVRGVEGGEAQIRIEADEADNASDRFRLVATDSAGFHIQSYDGSQYDTFFKGEMNGGVELYHNNVKKFETYGDGIKVHSSNAVLELKSLNTGTSTAFAVFYGYRTVADVGRLGEFQFINQRDNDVQAEIEVIANGDTNAYFDFKTNNAGLRTLRVDHAGANFPDDIKARFGNGEDLQIYHNNSSNTNEIQSPLSTNFRGKNLYFYVNHNTTSTEAIMAYASAQVELYHGGAKRLQTTSNGVEVHGNSATILNATCSTNSTASVQFANNEQNSAGDMRLMLKTAANYGSDPYIFFDAGGTNMCVGLHHLGTTSNQLRLGAGNAIHTINGIQINGFGNVFMNALNSGSGASDLRYNTSSGQVFYDSSTRLVKTDIQDCSYGLTEINKLKPRIYKRTDADNVVEIGFVADEVQSILPEIVSTEVKSFFTKDESDTEVIPSNVDLKRLTVVMTKAIQELASKVAALEAA